MKSTNSQSGGVTSHSEGDGSSTNKRTSDSKLRHATSAIRGLGFMVSSGSDGAKGLPPPLSKQSGISRGAQTERRGGAGPGRGLLGGKDLTGRFSVLHVGRCAKP